MLVMGRYSTMLLLLSMVVAAMFIAFIVLWPWRMIGRIGRQTRVKRGVISS